MSDVAAIVLAAGLSRRMGADNKLLLTVGQDVLLRKVVDACAAVSDYAVTVVTGHQADAVRAALRGAPVICAHNRRFEDGQMTSVDAGLRSAPAAADYLLALGDQPDINESSLRALLAAHHNGAQGRITVPMVNGQRGNPIVIPAALRDRMLADRVNLGCRNLTRTAPGLLHLFETGDTAFITDIDSPEDLAAARASLHCERNETDALS